MEMLYWFIPMIILLGIVSSYSDTKRKRISNRWLVYGLIYSVIVNVIIVIINLVFYAIPINNVAVYYSKYIFNCLIALLVSFFMWRNKLWNAGDAKLFVVFVCLMPLSVYSNNYLAVFPALIFLINVFVPYSIVIATKLLIRAPRKKKISVFKAIKKNFLIEIVILIGISWGLSFVTSGSLGMLQNSTLSVLFFFLARNFISNKINSSSKRYLAIKISLIMISILVIIFFFYDSAKESLILLLKLAKSALMSIGTFIVFRLFSMARDIESKKKPVSEDEEYITFAPAIFLGALLTILNHGLFYNFLKNILNR